MRGRSIKDWPNIQEEDEEDAITTLDWSCFFARCVVEGVVWLAVGNFRLSAVAPFLFLLLC